MWERGEKKAQETRGPGSEEGDEGTDSLYANPGARG